MSHILDELVSTSPNRRRFLKSVGAATATLCATTLVGTSAAHAEEVSETDILNFALNLEYLEAEFYTYAITGQSITNFGIGIDGQANDENPPTGGTTTGGSQVIFVNDEVFSREIAEEIAADERAHVALIRAALGAKAVAKPNINPCSR